MVPLINRFLSCHSLIAKKVIINRDINQVAQLFKRKMSTESLKIFPAALVIRTKQLDRSQNTKDDADNLSERLVDYAQPVDKGIYNKHRGETFDGSIWEVGLGLKRVGRN